MNRTQQQALKALLLTAPYSGLADAQAKADAINTNISADQYKKVEYSDVISYLMVVNKWLPIKVSTNDAAEELIDAVQHFESFDLNKPLVKAKIEATLDALITAMLLNASDKSNILSLADMTVAEALGLGTVKDYDVTNAENA
jgi:hypothetical protein